MKCNEAAGDHLSSAVKRTAQVTSYRRPARGLSCRNQNFILEKFLCHLESGCSSFPAPKFTYVRICGSESFPG